MRVKELKVFIVGNPPPGWGGRYFTFVKLTTDTGIIGIGECYCATFGPTAMTAMIEDVFGRYVEGMDPFHIEALWRKVYGSGYTMRPDVSLMGVLSGIEIALWDIVGKAVGKPVYELLGGRVHEKLRSYTYIYPDLAKGQTDAIYWNAEQSAERAAHYVSQGFTGIKFDPAAPYSSFDPRQPSLESMELCAKFCKLIREAVGTKADLLFGTHGQFTASGAIRFAKHIEPYDPLWFEEPTPPEKPEEMALVAKKMKGLASKELPEDKQTDAGRLCNEVAGYYKPIDEAADAGKKPETEAIEKKMADAIGKLKALQK